jgi:hypothetical protein
VELGRDKREEQVRELVVELVGLARREPGAAKCALERLVERARVRPCERPREERRRPRMRDQDAARRVRERLEAVPPVLVRPGQIDLGVERVSHSVEQPVLSADVPVGSDTRNTETLGHLAHADGSKTALVRERDRRTHDGVVVES